MLAIAVILVSIEASAQPQTTAEPCGWIRGRAHQYGGDGQLRIWHIGTHHEYTPDESSWDRVIGWLEGGVTKADKAYVNPLGNVYLFADFLVCPVEEFENGLVQRAEIKSVKNKHYAKSSGGRR